MQLALESKRPNLRKTKWVYLKASHQNLQNAIIVKKSYIPFLHPKYIGVEKDSQEDGILPTSTETKPDLCFSVTP